MENELTIEIRYRREDLESIYYLNGAGKALNKQGVKKLMLLALLSFVVLVVSGILLENNPNDIWIWLIVMSVIVFIFALIFLLVKLAAFYQWKNSVKKYINALDAKKETITCSPSSISIKTDTETTVTRWELVKQIKIFKHYISFYSGADYHIFPEASMHQPDYIALCDFMTKKMSEPL